jgi:Protein of unknown function (DUF3631)
MAKKKTSAQQFAAIFAMFMRGATKGERTTGERTMDAWLKRHGKTRADIQSILAQAVADDAASQPPPPPSDPRDAASNPFDDPAFTPAGLVEGITQQYVTMSEHVSVIASLWACFTHVYTQFAIAPRIELTSEKPDSGKSTLRKVFKHLVYRPNRDVLGTPAVLERFLARGPCTILLDELDHVHGEARERLHRIWNFGHERGAEISFMEGGREKYLNIYAPMLAAGVGKFLEATQKTRTFTLEMKPWTEATRPPRDYNVDLNTEELDAVYSYLRNWAQKVKLNPKPPMPPGVLRRYADNVRGLLSVADSCGPEWSRRAREAIAFLLEKEKAERPEILILRHTLVIIDTLGLDPIPSRVVNQELRRLDLPEARWNRYRGPGGGEYAHPLMLNEQAALMRESGVESKLIRPPRGKPFRGYWREWIVEALQERGTTAPPHLRLITPQAE